MNANDYCARRLAYTVVVEAEGGEERNEDQGNERKLKLLVRAQDQTTKKLRAELAQQSSKVRDLESQLSKSRKGLVRLPEPAELDQIGVLQAALAASQLRLNDMQQSFSWKITAPLRTLAKPFVKK